MKKTKNFFWTALTKAPWLLPSLGILIGLLLRMTFVEDMEYKEDEEYNFTQSQWIGNTLGWPWAGIPSGVYVPNPGMSIWVFAILAKICRCTTPTQLAHALQAFAVLGIALILPFVFRFLKSESEKTLWLWAFALSLVNPFLVLYQRKLWPEPFLPFFVMLTLMGWWRRSHWGAALVWGMVGAWLGQIHMSGFFYAFSLMVWTLCFEARPRKTHWRAWFVGSVLGALPLIPWAMDVIAHPVTGKISAGWNEGIQLKFWTFWITDPTGLHLGNPLGLMRGQGILDQISDFIRYPLLGGQATYCVGFMHVIALACVVFLYGSGMKRLWTRVRAPGFVLRDWIIGRDSPTSFVLNSTLIGCGVLMTLTGVVIRRYYMAITFPLEFIFLARCALGTKRGTRILALLWFAELMISANFVGYIHVNEGSTQGDYGEAYHKHPH